MSERMRNIPGLLASVAVLAAGTGWCLGRETERPVDPSPPARLNIAASHYGDMLAPTMMRKYLREHPALGYEIKYIEPNTPAEKAADLVLLIRVSEAAIREWTTRGYIEAHSGTAIGHNSFCVVVDPQCPLKEMSLADLKAVLGGSVGNLENLGTP